MASGDDDDRDAPSDQLVDLTLASDARFARLFQSPEFEAKAAMAMGSDAVVALLNRHAERTVELEAVVSEQAAALEELREALERLHVERDRERSRLTAEQQRLTEERDRLAAELRASRRARGELPRTGTDLRRWREERGLTQVEAAEMLGVGHATVERAEGTEATELLLGRGLRTALERDAAATRVVAQAGAPAAALTRDARAKKGPGGRAR